MRLKFRRGDDMHVHFRATSRMGQVAPFTAKHFARALVMPNVPAITTPLLVRQYYEEIKVATKGYVFQPLMTLKLHPGVTPEDIVPAMTAGAVAAKIYPEGVTTGSDDGLTVERIREMGDVFERMSSAGMVLCWHGEHPADGMDFMDAEKFMLPEIMRVVSDHPRLRQVVEHVTSREAVEWVTRAPDTVGATITPHHLELTRNDLVGRGSLGKGGKLNPHYFCWPMAKRVEDRRSLQQAAISGNPKFFLGTDSAPHHVRDKECSSGCAGVFSAPVAVASLVSTFDQFNAVDAIEGFMSEFGARFYGLPLNSGFIEVERSLWQVPEYYCDGQFVPFLAGKMLDWAVV